MTQIDRRRALAESLQEVIDHPLRRASDIKAANETARVETSQRRRRLVLVALVASWGTLSWLWLARPDWAFNPPLGIVAEAEFSEEEGLRYGMFLQAARIREFEADSGRLPASIAEAGEAEEGLRYEITDAGWRLLGTLGNRQLVLTSEMSADAFLAGDGAPP